jgi:hypothetical protein
MKEREWKRRNWITGERLRLGVQILDDKVCNVIKKEISGDVLVT